MVDLMERPVSTRSPGSIDEEAALLSACVLGLEPEALLDRLLHTHLKDRTALVSSFGSESAVLLHMVAQVDPALPVIFIDTGKLFGETLRYRDQLIAQLGLSDVRLVGPNREREAEQDPKGLLWSSDPGA